MTERNPGGSLPVDIEADNIVHYAEKRSTDHTIRTRYAQMWRRHGYPEQQVQQRLRELDQRTQGITGTEPESAATSTASVAGAEDSAPAVERAASEVAPAEQDAPRQEEIRMRMPGAFSRGLSSPWYWIKALGLAVGAGGVVFLLVAEGIHYLFSTAALLSWATAVPAAALAIPAFLGLLSGAGGEIREWVRLGGPTPLHWRR